MSQERDQASAVYLGRIPPYITGRSRTLIAVLLAAMKALEVGEYEARIQALEQAVAQREPQPYRGQVA